MEGPRIPRRNRSRRDIEIEGRVSLILITKCTRTLTNEPITVPIATPIAPNVHARKRLLPKLTTASETAAAIADFWFPVAVITVAYGAHRFRTMFATTRIRR